MVEYSAPCAVLASVLEKLGDMVDVELRIAIAAMLVETAHKLDRDCWTLPSRSN
jgi:hypothetical protein